MVPWKIGWVFNVIKIWTSNAHKIFILLFEESCIIFSNLKYKNKIVYDFLTHNKSKGNLIYYLILRLLSRQPHGLFIIF